MDLPPTVPTEPLLKIPNHPENEKKIPTQVNPTSLECIRNAMETQQERLGEILDIFAEIFQINLKTEKSFENFLTEVSRVAHFCAPFLKNGGQAKERILSAKIGVSEEIIKTGIQLFADWKAMLDGYIDVYRSQIPHQKTYLQEIKHIDQEYQDLSNIVQLVSKVKGEIQQRMGEDNLFLTPDNQKATKMISAVYGTSDVAINKDIRDYHTRTYTFRATQTDIKLLQPEFDNARSQFERSFCLLSYLIKNNYQCTYSTETFYFKCSSFNYLTSKDAINEMYEVYKDQLQNEPKISDTAAKIGKLRKKASQIINKKKEQNPLDIINPTSPPKTNLNLVAINTPTFDESVPSEITTLILSIENANTECTEFTLSLYKKQGVLNSKLDHYKKNQPLQDDAELERYFLDYIPFRNTLDLIIKKRRILRLKIKNLPSQTSIGYMNLCKESETLLNKNLEILTVDNEKFLKLFNFLTFLHSMQHSYSEQGEKLFDEGYKNGKYHFIQNLLEVGKPLPTPLLKTPIFFETYLGIEGKVPLRAKSVKFIKTATISQQEQLAQIVDIFSEIFQIEITPKNNFRETENKEEIKPKKDNFEKFLDKSKDTILFCSSVLKDGERATDETLISHAISLHETIGTVTTLFSQWNANLDTYLDVYTYRDEPPHQKTYILAMIRIDEQYQAISSSMTKISQVKGILRTKIKTRIAKDNLHLPTQGLKAIKITSKVYNIAVETIQEDISCYHTNTDNIRGIYNNIKSTYTQMDVASKKLVNSFCLLSYLIRHNCLRTNLTEYTYFPFSGFDYFTSLKTIKDMEKMHQGIEQGYREELATISTLDQKNPDPEK